MQTIYLLRSSTHSLYDVFVFREVRETTTKHPRDLIEAEEEYGLEGRRIGGKNNLYYSDLKEL